MELKSSILSIINRQYDVLGANLNKRQILTFLRSNMFKKEVKNDIGRKCKFDYSSFPPTNFNFREIAEIEVG